MVRALVYAAITVVLLVLVVPSGCQRVRERVLLSLLRESERPVDVAGDAPLVFRFPPTDVRAVALIDYQDALSRDAHVSFVPPDGSPLYAWAVGVCPTWSSACLDATPPRTISELTYGDAPEGFQRIEPASGPVPALAPHRLYGLALFGTRLFALKAFYRDERGVHLMDGARFAEAVIWGRRDELRDFVAGTDRNAVRTSAAP